MVRSGRGRREGRPVTAKYLSAVEAMGRARRWAHFAWAWWVLRSLRAEMEGGEEEGGRLVASLASVSAHSLPGIPLWPGLQW